MPIASFQRAAGRVLDVPPGYFFEEMTAEVAEKSPARARGLAEDQETFAPDPMTRRETLELVRAYYRIVDPRVRKCLFETTKAIAAAKDAKE